MEWLSWFGELVTMNVRISRECAGLCADLSQKYLTILTALELTNFCKYLGHHSESSCYDDVLKVCGDEVVQNISKIVSIGKDLSNGKNVELSILKTFNIKLPEIYLCLSRIAATYISSRDL
ncbi:MAG: hypothetical protein QXZ56_05620 [Sulfolobales archaeon]